MNTIVSDKRKTSTRMKQSTAMKLLSGLSIIALVLAFVMLIWSRNAIADFNNEVEAREKIEEAAEAFGNASRFLTHEARSYAATGDREYYDNYWNEVNSEKNREKSLEIMRKIGLTEEEEEMMSRVAEVSNNLVPIEDKAMKMAEIGGVMETL